MVGQNEATRSQHQSAAHLADDPPGVMSESRKRRIQSLGDSYGSTINPDWLAEMALDEASAPTSQYFLTGATPIIVTGAAIVIQPNGGELERGEH